MRMRRLARVITALALAGASGGCWDFQPDPPEGPSALPTARVVSVTIEYRQPSVCANVVNPCDEDVFFYASWMRPGGEVRLQAVEGSYVWTGTAPAVPVNFPPRDAPHLVRVFDPHLWDTATGGRTAAGLVVGGQMISFIDRAGTSDEYGLIYVDDNGVGHNPY